MPLFEKRYLRFSLTKNLRLQNSMLISPPFLIDSIEISDTLDAGLQPVAARDATTMAPEGNYPVSQSLIWHTGVHLQAPKAADADYAPVRAVADGTVIFVNPPRERINDA